MRLTQGLAFREGAARYLRWAPFVGIVGVLHPALGFAARDIVGQVGIEPPDDRELGAKHARVSSFVNTSGHGLPRRHGCRPCRQPRPVAGDGSVTAGRWRPRW